MGAFRNYRDESKNKNWGTEDSKLTIEQINCGSLLRIADGVEAMSVNFVRMQSDLATYKRLYIERGQQINTLKRSNASLRGSITKLKKKNGKSNNSI